MENIQPQSKLENSVSDELPKSVISDSIVNEQESTPVLSNDSNINLNDFEITNEEPEIVAKDNEEEEETFQDILGSGDLTKKIIRHGNKDDRPTRGEQIVINMVGKLEDKDDVIEKFENKEITLGDCEVIQGVDLALSLMNVGEIAVLNIAPRFGYGEKGLEPDVPGGAKLTYTVELISARPELQPEELTPADRLKIGQQKKDKGNWWYSRNENTMALHLYRKAIQYFGGSGEVNDDALEQLIQNERVKTLNNMAVVHMAMNSMDLALQSVDSVLAIDAINVKAIMRKGKILSDKGQNSAAAYEFKKALHISPNNKTIQNLLANVENVLVKERAQERELYKKMLGQKKSDDKENKTNSSNSTSNTTFIISGIVVAGVALLGGFCILHSNYPFGKLNIF
ncbi:peptidyl-prolyl cis-trans isomerase FKBP8 [Adelges cooleyi]|uniref:peptidyl-prolyl cis-trans isomerase FKBP8 n=1 Tax=Adelges cooleyi TaxID=133065 RepID=UPI00217F4403|nr:peptidyl-prolyl cis-trans isomerase FKBP8 [Adelges cooleyi]